MKKLILLVTIVLVFAASASAEITVGDPSFELQVLEGGNYGSPLDLPWESVGGGWVCVEGVYGYHNIPDGSVAATTGNQAVRQDLAAIYEEGVTYTLSAMAAARGAYSASGALDAWQIALHDTAGNELAATTGAFDLIDCQDGPEAWQEISVTYTATAADDGNPIRIHFANPVPGSYDYRFLVDDVHLVPEPATMVLLGLGGLLLRRKR